MTIARPAALVENIRTSLDQVLSVRRQGYHQQNTEPVTDRSDHWIGAFFL
jgi:hypothetical protein